jgi:hypothetical protein
MMHVSITRLWWMSLLLVVVCFGGKLWAFKWWRVNEVDAVIGLVILWLVVWLSSVRLNDGKLLNRKQVDDGR